MKINLFLSIFLSLVAFESAAAIRLRFAQRRSSNGPLMFAKWPPVRRAHQPPSQPQPVRHQVVYVRANRVPVKPLASSQQRIIKPNAPLINRYYRKNVAPQTHYRPQQQQNRFYSSQQAPNSNEYIFENPYANIRATTQPKKTVSLTGNNEYHSLRPIQPSNLAVASGYDHYLEPIDNHLRDREFDTNRNIHQYQVTEAPIENEFVPGNVKVFNAPAADALIQASNVKTIPLPIEFGFVTANGQMQSISSLPVAANVPENTAISSLPAAPAALVQLNHEPQQQLPDTYALPMSNQPQLQQHFTQQQAMMQGIPMTSYNPTYLVTQSNNLLNQHRERLFKPSPAFLGSMNQPTIDMTSSDMQSFADVNSVASQGQIHTSEQHQKQLQEQETKNQVTSYSSYQPFPGSQYGNTIFHQHADPSKPEQPYLSEQEVANLLNFQPAQYQNPVIEKGFVASHFYQQKPDPQIELENSQQQKQNDIMISQANEELKKTKNFEDVITPTTTLTATSTTTTKSYVEPTSKSAFEKHREKLAEQIGSTKLRIVVSENDAKNSIRRADEYQKTQPNENNVKEEYDAPTTQLFDNDTNDVTTDSNEDEYYPSDTESQRFAGRVYDE